MTDLGGVVCVGNGQADIAAHITVELDQTLSTMHDQLIVVIFDDVSENRKSDEPEQSSREL